MKEAQWHKHDTKRIFWLRDVGGSLAEIAYADRGTWSVNVYGRVVVGVIPGRSITKSCDSLSDAVEVVENALHPYGYSFGWPS